MHNCWLKGSGTTPMLLCPIYYLQQSRMQKIVLTLLATLNSKTAHPDLHFIYPTVSTEDKKNQKH
jgi:hypothetical protein